jgi:type I restriction enzyme R subunit
LLRTWAEQFEESWVGDTDVVDQATHDGFENLRLAFDRRFLETIMGRMDENEAIGQRILNDEESRTPLMGSHANRLYSRLRGPNSGTAS